MKKIFVVALLATMFASCYEDKGNYNYDKVMTFEVPNMNSTLRNIKGSAVLGVEFTAYPPVNFYNYTNPEDTNRIKYYWCLPGANSTIDTVCRERILKWTPDRVASSLGMYLFMEDPVTGQSASGMVQLTVSTPLTTGWVLLHDNNGQSDLSFIRPYSEQVDDPENDDPEVKITERRFQVLENYLSEMNGGPVGTNPVKVCWYATSAESKLLLLQDNPVNINGLSWKAEVNLEEEFVGGMPMGGFKDMMFLKGTRYLLGNDGRVYLNAEWSSFYSSKFFNSPLRDMETDKELIIDEFTNVYNSFYGNVTHVHDAENKRFLFVATNYYDVSTLYPDLGKEQIMNTNGSFVNDTSKDRYIDIANYDGYNLLFWGTRNGNGTDVKLSANSGGGTKSYMVFFFEKDGEIYVQFMLASGIIVGTVPGLPDYVQVPKWSKIEVVKLTEMIGVNTQVTNDLITKDTPRAFICGKSQSNNKLAWMDYMYFAKGNVVYCLDFETKNLYEYYKLPEGVNVKLLELNFHDTELAIYADDNTFRTIKCSPSNLNNFDYDSKLAGIVENLENVKQILYVRKSQSDFTMPTSNPDRIVWP